MATASLWKVENNRYALQFNKVKPKERSVIFSLLKDWQETGSGFHRDGSQVLIFSKNLLEEENIYRFVRNLPFPLIEEKKTGEIKRIKTAARREDAKKSLTEQKKSAKIKGKRICSKCGEPGHNVRTCKSQKAGKTISA